MTYPRVSHLSDNRQIANAINQALKLGENASTGGGGTTTNALTFNNSGSGAASGTTFDGSAAKTISYNTIGAQPAGSYLTGNQTITLSGDVTGSGATAITTTLANSGVTAGTYGDSTHTLTATVDAKGRVTAMSTNALATPAITLISKQTPTGTGTVSFTSIPGTYNHLLIVASGRSTAGSTPGVDARMTFNSDTSAHYDYVQMQIQNTTVGANAVAAQTSFPLGIVPWSGATASNSGWGRAEIFNYADTNLFKSCHISRATIGATTLGTTFVASDGGGMWRGTAAITRIDITLSAGNWDTGSEVCLYGIT